MKQCGSVQCRAGRECRVLSTGTFNINILLDVFQFNIYQIFKIYVIFVPNCSLGIAVCICQRKCPERKHPVCGSDGVAYENHCELHREACIQGMIKLVTAK